MSGVNHIAGGVVFTGIYLSMSDINIFSSAAYLFFTAFFSLLPDIDHTSSIIGKPFYPISKYLDRKFGHRTITHSLLVYIGLIIFVKIFELIISGGNVITHIFILAYASHLILDMLTVKGIPLFYPFKKNPCVIPGNPKFRFRSSDFKTEAMVFGIFILLTFSLQDLFANGFWNTYNRTWDSVKALYNEKFIYSKMINVKYDLEEKGIRKTGTAILVDADLIKAVLFDKGFITVIADSRINKLVPERTLKNIVFKEQFFTNISFDSLNNLLKNKPVLSLKLQSTLPIEFVKDNKPQSSITIDLDYLFNPVFQSTNIDSVDRNIETQIALTEEEKSNVEARIQFEKAENINNSLAKEEAIKSYNQLLNDINSDDLATKEKATKDLAAAKNKYDQFSKLRPSIQTSLTPIIAKLAFLNSKLHIKKFQSINGFVSYFTVSN